MLGLKKVIRFQYLKKKWRKQNKHNKTTIGKVFPVNNVEVGKETYGELNVEWMAPLDAKLKIGNYCSIGPKVTFLVGGEHDYKRISTFPFQSMVYHEKGKNYLNRDIIVEDDVWLGYDVLVLSGVKIGKGSVVGAKSIVTKDIPPYSIYVGNKVIKRRFNKNIIEKLMSIDYNLISHHIDDDYRQHCQTEINEENIDAILNSFESHS